MPRKRTPVSVTIDPALLDEVDAFVAAHPATDRSKVFNQALQLWVNEQLRIAMEAQFDGPDAPPEEQAAWDAIRRAAANNFARR